MLPHDRAACLAVGMDDFLTKPVKLDMLKATIERQKSIKQSGRISAMPSPMPMGLRSTIPRAG